MDSIFLYAQQTLNRTPVFWIWGLIGVIYILYARQKGETVPFLSGLTLVIMSCFVPTGTTLTEAALSVVIGTKILMGMGW